MYESKKKKKYGNVIIKRKVKENNKINNLGVILNIFMHLYAQ